jgi:hypothetical protein
MKIIKLFTRISIIVMFILLLKAFSATNEITSSFYTSLSVIFGLLTIKLMSDETSSGSH